MDQLPAGMRVSAMRVRAGTEPKDVDGLIIDGPRDHKAPLNGWLLFRRAASKERWLSLKLVSAKPRPGAANYWLGWNLEERRLGRVRDGLRLLQHQPALCAALETELLKFTPETAEYNPVYNPEHAEDTLMEYRAMQSETMLT